MDHELPLVPFIDFMICLVAFLMVTAVWVEMSRINASAKLPGGGDTPAQPQKELHVSVSGKRFELRWQQGATVLDTQQVARAAVNVNGEPRFPALSQALTAQWNAQGQHRAVRDPALDRAVMHVQNDLPFSEIVAVLDALHAPRKGGKGAFEVAFATN